MKSISHHFVTVPYLSIPLYMPLDSPPDFRVIVTCFNIRLGIPRIWGQRTSVRRLAMMILGLVRALRLYLGTHCHSILLCICNRWSWCWISLPLFRTILSSIHLLRQYMVQLPGKSIISLGEKFVIIPQLLYYCFLLRKFKLLLLNKRIQFVQSLFHVRFQIHSLYSWVFIFFIFIFVYYIWNLLCFG